MRGLWGLVRSASSDQLMAAVREKESPNHTTANTGAHLLLPPGSSQRQTTQAQPQSQTQTQQQAHQQPASLAFPPPSSVSLSSTSSASTTSSTTLPSSSAVPKLPYLLPSSTSTTQNASSTQSTAPQLPSLSKSTIVSSSQPLTQSNLPGRRYASDDSVVSTLSHQISISPSMTRSSTTPALSQAASGNVSNSSTPTMSSAPFGRTTSLPVPSSQPTPTSPTPRTSPASQQPREIDFQFTPVKISALDTLARSFEPDEDDPSPRRQPYTELGKMHAGALMHAKTLGQKEPSASPESLSPPGMQVPQQAQDSQDLPPQTIQKQLLLGQPQPPLPQLPLRQVQAQPSLLQQQLSKPEKAPVQSQTHGPILPQSLRTSLPAPGQTMPPLQQKISLHTEEAQKTPLKTRQDQSLQATEPNKTPTTPQTPTSTQQHYQPTTPQTPIQQLPTPRSLRDVKTKSHSTTHLPVPFIDVDLMAQEQLTNLKLEREWFARCDVVPSVSAILAMLRECRKCLATNEYLQRCNEFPRKTRVTSFDSQDGVLRGFVGIDGWTVNKADINISPTKGKQIKSGITKSPWYLKQVQDAFEFLGSAIDDHLITITQPSMNLVLVYQTLCRVLEQVVRAWELLTHQVTDASFPAFIPSTTVLEPPLGEDTLIEFGVLGGEVTLKLFCLHVEWAQKKRVSQWGTGKSGMGRLENNTTALVNGVWCKSYQYQECTVSVISSHELHICVPSLTKAYNTLCRALGDLTAFVERVAPLIQS
ncbi:hypothetical protein Pelo_14422 [Pelomyxa schiedti]|nr:hypothetical protein Pelo_14422 [Pelomyxa schiedti]